MEGTADMVMARVREQMRPGGHPAREYRRLGDGDGLTQEENETLTSEVIENLEARIVALEARDEKIGLAT